MAAAAAAAGGRTPEELADAIFGCLRRFTVPEGDGEGGRPPSPTAVSETMEAVFGLFAVVKKLPRADKVRCVLQLSKHGAFPLIVAMMVPESATFSLACTFLGIMLEDEDLLSHRIGKTLFRDRPFLTAIDTGLLVGTEDRRAETGLLVSQMLGNVLKSASAEMMAQVANFGRIVRSLAAPLATAVNSVDTMDWRHPFVAADALFLLEASGKCARPLDEANVGQIALALFKTAASPTSAVGATLRKRTHLLHRAAAIGLLWLGRQRVLDEDIVAEVAAVAKGLQAAGCGDHAAEEARGDRHAIAHVLHALAGLAAGDHAPHDVCRAALAVRVRDWTAIEADAVTKVRSPEFAAAQAQAQPPARTAATAPEAQAAAGATATPPRAAAAAPSTESVPLAKTARENQAAERARQADRTKAEGNRLFSAGDHKGALEQYGKAADLLEEQQAEGGAIAAAADVAQSRVWSNCAACHLHLEQYEEAAEAATDSIDADPTFPKGWYRRARARLALGQLAGAKSDLAQAEKLQPGVGSSVAAEIARLETEATSKE